MPKEKTFPKRGGEGLARICWPFSHQVTVPLYLDINIMLCDTFGSFSIKYKYRSISEMHQKHTECSFRYLSNQIWCITDFTRMKKKEEILLDSPQLFGLNNESQILEDVLIFTYKKTAVIGLLCSCSPKA